MPDDGLRTDRATPARIYDYLLGGENNFAADREAAEQLLSAAPEVGVIARANRAFLARAVRYLAEAGVRQFIDLGAGLPTAGAVHEVARSVAPDVRVAYVDNDPLVHAHARTLPPQDGIALIDADLRSPGQVLDHPDLRRLISLDEPVAVMFMAVLHFVADEQDPYGIVASYRDATAPGSYVAITHATHSASDDRVTGVYAAKSTSHLITRSPSRVAGLFAGYDLVEPGVVPLQEWRDSPEGTATRSGYGGVGRKSASRTR